MVVNTDRVNINITGRVTEQAPRTDSMNADVDLYSLLNIIAPYDTEFSYPVVTTDENGQIYECPVQPARKSDKSLLDMLIRENA